MAIRNILVFPEPRLRETSKEVTEFNAALQSLEAELYATMESVSGIGLAAIQVGIPLRIAVTHVEEPLTIVNPQIESLDATTLIHEEGCLSLPGIRSEITRPKNIRLTAQDIKGAPFEMQVQGLLAVCLQHEADHMDGKLLIDRISPLKRAALNTELRNLIALQRKQTAS